MGSNKKGIMAESGKVRVADYIVKFLNGYGVKDFFYLPGGGVMHLIDGLACNKHVGLYCLHHEQSIAMALEAYSRTTGHYGVGYFTTGPGATNAITGLAGAWLDSVPCMFISGQVKRRDTTYMSKIPGIRQIGVQEVNIIPIVQSLTKYAAFVEDPQDIRYHLEKAIYLSKEGRPGPVWLDIPLDVQGAIVDGEKLRGFLPPKKIATFSKKELGFIVEKIKNAKRPLIVGGYGIRISGAISALLGFVSKTRIPVVTTYCGADLIGTSHPQFVGRIGIKGDRAGNLAMQNSDLLLVIGSSMPVSNTSYDPKQFAREAYIIVADVDETSHKKPSMRVDRFIKIDAKELLEALQKKLGKISIGDDWVKACRDWRERYPVCLPEYANLKKEVNVYYFIEKLSRLLTPKDVIVTDTGSGYYVGSQGIKVKQGMRYLASGGLCTMGYNLPASIGASIALGKKRVMCITGDGSLQQNIQELQSVVHHRLPLKIFVINNKGYLSIRNTQEKLFSERYLGESRNSGISFPDLKKIAYAYGIRFVRIAKSKGLEKKLAQALKFSGPVICEIMSPENQPVIPTVASQRRPDGSMVSKPLEDMYPFLDREEFRRNMFIRPLDE